MQRWGGWLRGVEQGVPVVQLVGVLKGSAASPCGLGLGLGSILKPPWHFFGGSLLCTETFSILKSLQLPSSLIMRS